MDYVLLEFSAWIRMTSFYFSGSNNRIFNCLFHRLLMDGLLMNGVVVMLIIKYFGDSFIYSFRTWSFLISLQIFTFL